MDMESGTMIKETLMGQQYRVYKNSPKCPICEKPMRYLYTHLASNRSVWRCRECQQDSITYETPEDDGDPSKRGSILILLPVIDHSPFFYA